MMTDFHWQSNIPPCYGKNAARTVLARMQNVILSHALRIIDRVVETTRSLFISFVPWLT